MKSVIDRYNTTKEERQQMANTTSEVKVFSSIHINFWIVENSENIIIKFMDTIHSFTKQTSSVSQNKKKPSTKA